MTPLNNCNEFLHLTPPYHLLSELYLDPHWNQMTDENKQLGESFFDIVPFKNSPFTFVLRYRLKNKDLVLAPFWVDIKHQKWCFINGNPHAYSHFQKMLEELLFHLDRGETISLGERTTVTLG